MAENRSVPFLRLVQDAPLRSAVLKPRDSVNKYWQPSLFPEFSPNVVLAVDLEHLDKENFINIMDSLRPNFIVDLRVSPRFDYANFNRRVAFDFFESIGSTYFDFTGDNSVRDERDARLNPAFVSDYVRKKVCKYKPISGPMAFFIGGREAESEYVPLLAKHLSGGDNKIEWMLA